MLERRFLRLSYVVPPQCELSVLVKPCTVTQKGYEDTSYVFPTWSPAWGAFVARSGDRQRRPSSPRWPSPAPPCAAWDASAPRARPRRVSWLGTDSGTKPLVERSVDGPVQAVPADG